MSDKLSEKPKKGEALVGNATEYAAYVNFGTSRQAAQPFLSASQEIVRRKANKTFERGMDEAIFKGLRRRFKKVIDKNVEFIGTNLDESFDQGVEDGLVILAVAGNAQAKALCPVGDTGNLRRNNMWKTSEKEGGFGSES